MRNWTVFLSLILAAAPVWAQRGRGGMMRPPAFQALDTDRDGVISPAEMAAAADALKKLDRNGDGKLTADEVRPQMAGRGRGEGPGEQSGPSADEMVTTLLAFDKNADGKLSKDEVPERMQGLFERADLDKDGVLTADEIRKSAAATSAPAGRGRGERGRELNFLRVDPIFAALDADSDGEISAAELAAAPAVLKTLDKDGDGRLTPDEVPMRFGRGGGPR